MRLAPVAFLLSSALAASRLWSDGPTYRSQLVSLHQSLVEIPSISGDEVAVGEFLVDYLAQRDFAVERQFVPSNASGSGSAAKPRFNVLAWPSGQKRSAAQQQPPRVLVTSHIDVVPPHIPYSRSDAVSGADTTIAGRGSVDAKASVAAQIIAVLELLRSGRIDAADVMLLFVVSEETSGAGMRHFSKTAAALDPPMRFEAAIFGEPTEGKLACGHKGLYSCSITAHGKAGHSGYPELGKSAVEVLMRGLVKVLDTDVGSSEEFGNTTINVGTINGGVAHNVIPELAVAGIAGRVAIGPEVGGDKVVGKRVQDILRSVDEEAFEFACHGGYGVVRCECDIEGFEKITVNYGTDVPNLQGDHARYLYGPGSIFVAHGADEAIKLGDLERAVEDFEKIILHTLRNRDDTAEL